MNPDRSENTGAGDGFPLSFLFLIIPVFFPLHSRRRHHNRCTRIRTRLSAFCGRSVQQRRPLPPQAGQLSGYPIRSSYIHLLPDIKALFWLFPDRHSLPSSGISLPLNCNSRPLRHSGFRHCDPAIQAVKISAAPAARRSRQQRTARRPCRLRTRSPALCARLRQQPHKACTAGKTPAWKPPPGL